MRKVISVKSHLLYNVALILLLAISIGCTTKKPGPLIAPYYKSVVEKENNTASKIPFSIRINSIAFDLPTIKLNIGVIALKFFPLLSAIQISEKSLFNIIPGAFKYITREPGEIEKVLTEELNKTSLFNEVTFEGVPKDFDIRGKVDFIIMLNRHSSGLGILGFLPPFSLIFPMATYYFTCEAHFEVVSTSDNNIVLSKDYLSDKIFLLGRLYSGNIFKAKSLFGKKIFPVIVEEFINDLKESLKQKV